MADRTTKVTLVANVSGYINSMNEAGRSTRNLGSASEELAKHAEFAGRGLLAVGAAGLVGLGAAVAKSSQFDSAMSSVQASTLESAKNMGLLRDAAVKAGADSVFSATEAANAEEELAKAGVSTADVLGGALKGSLDLASAGSLGVAQAAEIAATAMTQFKLKGSEVPHIADLLAAGAGKAQGSVEDLGAALGQGGLVAAQAGQSIGDTTGVLAAFASAGLTGSDAGTSLKTMLLSLEGPSTVAQKTLDQYGITVYDSQGKMLSFTGIADQLKTKLGGLSQEQRNAALSTIFGSDAIRSASILYDQGATGIQAWIDRVNDSGYAAEVARQRLDNLSGDVEYLSGAFDTALITAGSATNDMLRSLTQTATGAVNAFNDAPPAVQNVALGLGAVTTAAALAGGTFLLGVPKVLAFSASLQVMAASEIPAVAGAATRLTGAISGMGSVLRATGTFLTGPWGIALAAGAVGVTVLSKAIADGKTSAEDYQNALITAAKAGDIIAAASKQWAGSEAVFGDYSDKLKDLPSLLDKVKAGQDNALNNFSLSTNDFDAIQSLRDFGKQLGELAGKDLPAAQRAFKLLSDSQNLSTQQQTTLLSLAGPYRDALVEQANQLGLVADDTTLLSLAQSGGADAAKEAADAYQSTAEQVTDLNKQLKDLIDSVNAANGVGQDAVTSNADYQQSLADAAETLQKARDGVDGYSLSLDASTVAGSSNLSMLAGLAQSGNDAAAAQYALDGNTIAYKGTLQSVHDNIYEQAKAFGASDEQASNLADTISGIPSEKQWTAIANTQQAMNAAAALQSEIDALPRERIINIITRSSMVDLNGPASGSGRPGTFAVGGAITGPGSGTSDSVPALLSNGEHVLTAREVMMMGGQRAVYDFRKSLAQPQGYAYGGSVSDHRYAPSIAYQGAGGAPVVKVELTQRGGVDILQYVDVRVNGAIIENEDRNATTGYAGARRER